MGWIIPPQDEHKCELPKITNAQKYVGCLWQCDQCKLIFEVIEKVEIVPEDPRDGNGPLKLFRNEWKLVSE